MIELVAKDKNEKFQYEGRCKLTIDAVSKLLLVEPIIEEYKMISAMFKWKFVASKNMLFVFAEYDFQDFALIFDNSDKCNNANEWLIKKGVISGTDELIQQRFLPQLFTEISMNSSVKMKEILFNWIEKHDEEQKEGYIQLLKDYDIYDFFYSKKRKRQQKARNGIESNNILPRKGLKRKHPCSTQIIEIQNFEELKYFQRGVLKRRLFIFNSTDREYCYEYCWVKDNKYFQCHSCRKLKNFMSAKIIKRNGKDIVQLNGHQHLCQLRPHKRIIEKTNYEMKFFESKKRLILFLDSNRVNCYEYYYHSSMRLYYCCGCSRMKHLNIISICQKEDGTEFALLYSEKHVCEIQQYNPEKYVQKEIVESAKFEIFKNVQDGIDRSRLVIFTSSEKTTCYEYFWYNLKKRFICCGCMNYKKSITAQLCENSNESQFLKLSRTKHVCAPRQYDPKKFEMSKEIVESANFRIFHYQHRGTSTSKLVIFCPTNKNLCYEYFLNPVNQIYLCCACPFRNRVTATVCHNEKSQQYLILSKAEHVCELREFDPEKFKDDKIIDKSMYSITSSTSKNGTKHKRLIIFTTEEKKYYYKFNYRMNENTYECPTCHNSKIYIAATIQNEGKENEFVYLSNQNHICDPLEYSPLVDNNIILAPNFQFIKRKSNGKIIQKLVIFTNEEKSKCYEYTWIESGKNFLCIPCKDFKTYVYARITKNDEGNDCVEVCQNQHQCQPISFIPEDISSKIVKLPGFKLFEESTRKTVVKKLAIFDSTNKNLGYIYSYQPGKKLYKCQKCGANHRYVTARILKDENGENYVEMNKTEHICELQKI